MTDRPIIFSGPMVRAILEGRKTMTRRRLLRPTNQFHASYIVPRLEKGEIVWSDGKGGMERPKEMGYAPGDRLWVRETYCTGYDYDDHDKPIGDEPRVFYAATECPRWYDTDTDTWLDSPRWKPSIFMPRSASRITLIVEAVRVERLQDISEEDARAEGIPADYLEHIHGPNGFRDLWNSLHGPDAWAANPWVAAISFRTIHANIDAIKEQP